MAFFKDFSDKIVFVTGAGRGIGKAIAQRFYDGNGVVIIADRDIALAEGTANKMDPSGARVIPLQCDVAQPDSVNAAVATVFNRFGTIHILVNNAGFTRDAMFHKMSYSQWDEVLKVHLYGTFNTCQAVIPKMRDQNYGRIVNIASIAAFGQIGVCNYSAAKAGIIGLSRSLAKESATKGITVNVIAPAPTETELVKSVPAEVLEASRKRILAGRYADPDEVAAAVAFLCTEDASYISGQTIAVSCAYTTS